MTLIVTKENLELGIFVKELEEIVKKIEEKLKKQDEINEIYKRLIDRMFSTLYSNSKEEVKPKETFDFMTAVKYMKEGKNVRRKEWSTQIYMNNEIENQVFIINKFLGIGNHTNILLDDYLSNDWELYDEQ